ncbi:hypothetical protein Tco_1312390 [Tanacetum coccineum]
MANYSLPGPLTYGLRQLARNHVGSFGGDIDFGNGSFGRRYPRRRIILSHEGDHVSCPISGGGGARF